MPYKDPIKQREYWQKYHSARREKRISRMREYYQENKDECKSRQKKWVDKNRGIVNAHGAKHRASKLKATPVWLTEEQHGLIQDYYEVAQLLNLTVDHIVPLQGENVCGLHVPWNLDLLTKAENSAKRNLFCPD